jgi:putative transposase
MLRKLAIARPNQVWATDISYIPMAKGFVYLVAIVDWFSRKVLAWRVSITMEADFCVEALEEALARYGKPEISTPTKAASLAAWLSPVCCCARKSPSAWMAGELGATTSWSNACGVR